MLEHALPFLEQCEELVIDVRGNGGGSDSAFYPLLKYCFPAGDHTIRESGMEINYSERNCESRLRIFREYFGEDITHELKERIDSARAELLAKRGRGFVRVADENMMVEGRKYPMKVKILTDECCCSAGEYFVELASKSPKVTVMGRPTMGIQDYSNCTNAIWDTFYLAYPTSRDCRIDLGQGLLGRGVPVDEYIRWTPEFLDTCRNFECDL